MASVAQYKSDIDRILSLINKEDIEALKAEDYDQFQFVGFDPQKLLATLLALKARDKISDESFINDIVQMVGVGLIKGNVNDHNMTKMSDEGQINLKKLMKKYSIHGGGAESKSSDYVTFPRIVATFPHIAVRFTSTLGAKSYRGGPFMSFGLPDPMQVSVFPSVIPSNLEQKVKSFMLTASLCYSMDQSIQISRLTKPDLKALAAKQSGYIDVSHSSPIPDQDTRKNTFNKLGLPSRYIAILEVVKMYSTLVDASIVIPTEDEYKAALAVV